MKGTRTKPLIPSFRDAALLRPAPPPSARLRRRTTTAYSRITPTTSHHRSVCPWHLHGPAAPRGLQFNSADAHMLRALRATMRRTTCIVWLVSADRISLSWPAATCDQTPTRPDRAVRSQTAHVRAMAVGASVWFTVDARFLVHTLGLARSIPVHVCALLLSSPGTCSARRQDKSAAFRRSCPRRRGLVAKRGVKQNELPRLRTRTRSADQLTTGHRPARRSVLEVGQYGL